MIKPNIIAERAVIGAILLDADKIMPEALEILDEDDFLTPELRTIYKTCCGYFVDGKPIDPVILDAQFQSAYNAELTNCIAAVPSTTNWKEYARLITDTAKRARAYDKTTELLEALTYGQDIGECQDLAVAASEALNEERHDNTVSAMQGFEEFLRQYQKPNAYIRTGIENLDKYTYIEKGDFIIVGARPSVGKTALTLQLMLHMARKHRVAYFSLETKNSKLMGRLIANLGQVNMGQIKNKDMTVYKDFTEVQQRLKGLDFHLIEAAGWSVAQIKAKAVQLGAEIIFVDYLGLVRAEGKSPYERVSNISLALHTLALSSNIAVIAVCQLNREGKGEPDMTHLRESGQIEQDADAILLLHAPDGNEFGTRKIIIAKNKEGQVGALTMAFEGEYQRFLEFDGRYE